MVQRWPEVLCDTKRDNFDSGVVEFIVLEDHVRIDPVVLDGAFK